MKKHDLDWTDVLGGRAQPPRGRRGSEIGVDYLAAANSRIRQLQAHNMRLEAQIRRLKARLEAAGDEE